MRNVQTFMFESGSFYWIRVSTESLAYPKSGMFFIILMAGGDAEGSTFNLRLKKIFVYLFTFVSFCGKMKKSL